MTQNQQNTINAVVALLKSNYQNDTTGHDWFHLERVWRMAKQLAKGQTVNHFVVEMAALLHDVDDYKFKQDGEDPLANTKKILQPFTLPETEYTLICDIASHVSYKGSSVPDTQQTLEGKIVQDADRLDAVGAIGIARTFIYNAAKGNMLHDPATPPRQHLSFAAYKEESTAINHFYEKLLLVYDRLHTEKAKKIGVKRHTFLKKFLDEFLAEWEGSR